MKKLTVIIPCFNEEEALTIYYREMSKVMEEMPEGKWDYISHNKQNYRCFVRLRYSLQILEKRFRFHKTAAENV